MATLTRDIEQNADALADLAEVLQLLGRDNESGPPLEEALTLYEQKGDSVMLGRIRARLGRPEAA